MLHRFTPLLTVTACVFMPCAARADAYDPPVGYYSGATGTGATLKGQLTSAMSSGHIQRTYGDFRFSAAITDQDPDNSSNILLVYNRASVPGAWSTNPLVWNREHVWPQAAQPGSASNGVAGNLGDPHALRPANPTVNSNRGNLPFGFENTTGSHRTVGSYYFPGDADKGDIARSLFYSDTRWSASGLSLTDNFPSGNQMGDLSSLIAWHYLDTPDDFERRRNQAIYSSAMNPSYYTNNRNAYIDHPEFVWSIYVDQQNDSQLFVDASPNADGGSSFDVDLGSVIVGAAVPEGQEVTLNKNGFDGTYFEVNTSGDATSSVTGRHNAFAINAIGTDSLPVTVGLNASTTSAGLQTGAVSVNNLDVTTSGGAGRGANDADDVISVNLNVLDHATPSFDSQFVDNTLTLDFGTVTVGSSVPAIDFEIWNLEELAGFTADLELDSFDVSGDSTILTTDLVSFMGASSLAAGESNSFSAAIDTSLEGEFSAIYTLSFSDEDLPGSTALDDLTLALQGAVEAAPANNPDFDQDLDVDGSDFLTFQRGFGITQGALHPQGDANGDGAVDATDLAIWEQEYGAAESAVIGEVPEPPSMLLVMCFIAMIASLSRCL